ncbi:MAG: conjugative transposon protein TraM [Flavisolibacter sp.]
MKNETAGWKRKRKMLLLIPLFTLPFVTLAFWALGGGDEKMSKQSPGSGLNAELPPARVKEEVGEDKLSFYEQADQDSIRLGKQHQSQEIDFLNQPDSSSFSRRTGPLQSYTPDISGTDKNEQKVYAKLYELQKQLRQNTQQAGPSPASQLQLPELHQMPAEERDATPDPEIDRLNQMMDKVLDIQHTERTEQKTQAPGRKNAPTTFFVQKASEYFRQNHFEGEDSANGDRPASRFYLEEWTNAVDSANAYPAFIYGDQSIVSGSDVRLCLNENIDIKGAKIVKGSFLYGVATLSASRLLIHITSIRNGNSIYPVDLSVYDLDGQEGINIPGSDLRDASRSAFENSMQKLDIMNLDPGVKAQAAATGLEAIKGLLSKKARKILVHLSNGYEVLLKNKVID